MSHKVAVSLRYTLFQAGALGYHTFRIPALVNLGDGIVLIAAEGRRHGVRIGAKLT